VWENKHAGFRQEISIDMLGLNHRENFAIDEVQHFLPGVCRDGFEPRGARSTWEVSWRRAEPYL